jgi:methylglutaconyl-CoA hydratase
MVSHNSNSIDSGDVTVAGAGSPIVTVRFGHPSSNSLPRALLGRLAQSIREAGAAHTTRVLILESSGTGPFCAGASFDELLAIKTVAEGERFFSGFAEVILALHEVPQPSIARVQGKCAGGGVGLACATDFTFAVRESAVRLSELAVGIGPFTIGPVVQRRIGSAAFSELALSAEWRDAEWAHRHGIFTEIFPDIGGVERRIVELSERLSGYPSSATTAVRRMAAEGFGEGLKELLAKRVRAVSELVVTPEAQALIAAAKSPRKA